jgi:metal-dependent hydrolase (beta-lactamase superfamily II)
MFIQYYWTGAAINANVDTTHFVIWEWGKRLYVDAWWWMSLWQRVLRWEIEMPKYLFMTHCHTDHLMWLPFMIRIIWNNSMTLFLTSELAQKVKEIMFIVGKWPWYEKKIENKNIVLHIIDEDSEIGIYDWKIKPINLYSKKVEQYW